MTEGTAKFFLLQVNDALFPIGGYSHSYGLETYIQKGLVHDEDSAEEFIHKRLEYNFLYNEFLWRSDGNLPSGRDHGSRKNPA